MGGTILPPFPPAQPAAFDLYFVTYFLQLPPTATPTPTATATRTATPTLTAMATAYATPIVLAPRIIVAPPPRLGAFLDGVRGTERNFAAATAQAAAAQAASQASSLAAVAVRPPSTGDAGRLASRDGGEMRWAPFALAGAGAALIAAGLWQRRGERRDP